jgi:hypothetical protein
MKKIPVLIIGLCIVMVGSAFALELESGRFGQEIQSVRYSDQGRDYESYLYAQKDDEAKSVSADKGIYEYEYKSPRRAFLYSLVIPGWGQKYAGSTVIKPLFFLAAEAASWAMYAKYHSDGNKKTDEFEAYADVHWFEYDTTGAGYSYRDWLLAHGLDEDSLTHQLPDTKTQQYYEMIGKYDQFRGGWDDYWDDQDKYDSTASPHREYYNTLRGKANDLYDKGNTFIIVAMVNHLISAIDAAVAANRHNRNQSGDNWMSVKVEMKRYSATEEMPIVKVAYKF